MVGKFISTARYRCYTCVTTSPHTTSQQLPVFTHQLRGKCRVSARQIEISHESTRSGEGGNGLRGGAVAAPPLN